MDDKKRESNLVPILVAIVALIGLSMWYHYLGEYTIKKVDAVLGVDEPLKIEDLIIEKGFNDIGGVKSPEIRISYSTSRVSESYMQINEVKSNTTISKSFSKKITLSRDFFGKNVELKIYAKDGQGKEATILRVISVPNNFEPVITVLNT